MSVGFAGAPSVGNNRVMAGRIVVGIDGTEHAAAALRWALEEAAQYHGHNRNEAFFLITLPQINPGVVGGALVAYIN